MDDKPTASERMQQDFELMKLFAETYEQIDSNYVTDVDRRKLVEAAIRGMVSHLDQYSTYIPPEDLKKFERHLEQEFVGIGIGVNANGGALEIVSPLPDSPAFKAGLRTGDIVTAIDGTAVAGLTAADVTRLLSGPPGRPVVLSVIKPSSGDQPTEPTDITVIRNTVHVPTVVGLRKSPDQLWQFMLDDVRKVGYVRITHFSRKTAGELRTAVEALLEAGAKALVMDLRSNPGGLIDSSIEIADMLLDSGRIVSVKGRAVPERVWKARRGDTIPAIPLAVVVNRLSASASEVLSACLQDNNRAVIVGERTWGKGSVQKVIDLEGGRSALKLTTASYFRPSGINIHRLPTSTIADDWGVKPSSGCEVALTDEQWSAWTAYREAADNQNAAEPGSPLPEFADLQLNTAVEKLVAALDAAATP